MHLDAFSSGFERLSSHPRACSRSWREIYSSVSVSTASLRRLLLLRAFKARISRYDLNCFFGGDPTASSLAFNITQPPLELVNGWKKKKRISTGNQPLTLVPRPHYLLGGKIRRYPLAKNTLHQEGPPSPTSLLLSVLH